MQLVFSRKVSNSAEYTIGSQVYSFGGETKLWSQLSGFGSHPTECGHLWRWKFAKFLPGIEASGHLVLALFYGSCVFLCFALKPFCSALGWTQPNCPLLRIVINVTICDIWGQDICISTQWPSNWAECKCRKVKLFQTRLHCHYFLHKFVFLSMKVSVYNVSGLTASTSIIFHDTSSWKFATRVAALA